MLHEIPTDTVLRYYPTTWSYVGEHFLAWCVAAFPMVLVFFAARQRQGTRSNRWRDVLTVGVIALIAEVLSSAYLWWVATPNGEEPKLWYADGFGTYLWARAIPWTTSFMVILGTRALIWKGRGSSGPPAVSSA